MSSNSSLTILLYHGVTDCRSEGIENFSGKHLPSDVFRVQMEMLRDQCTVLSMDEVVYLYHRGKGYPESAVAVTFDDGFENNYTVAAPILRDFSIPATFYISTGFIDTARMFWVDEVEDSINRAAKRFLRGHSLSTPADKIRYVNQIKQTCKRLQDSEARQIISNLCRESRIEPQVSASHNYRKITWDQVCRLDAEELFTIGAHTVNHRILSLLPEHEMIEEIDGSLSVLREKLGHEMVHFSYPEGQEHHYNQRVIEVLKDRGVVCSPSAVDGINDVKTDLFHLRRIMPGFNGRVFPIGQSILAGMVTAAR